MTFIQESQTGEIRLEEDDPDSVKRMIDWIYSGSYDDNQIDSNELDGCESSNHGEFELF